MYQPLMKMMDTDMEWVGYLPPCGGTGCGELIPICFVVFVIFVAELTLSVFVFFVRLVVTLL